MIFVTRFFSFLTAPAENAWLVRRVFATGLGLLCLNSFLILFLQGPGLFGPEGLAPWDRFFPEVQRRFGSNLEAFWALPSLFHLAWDLWALKAAALLGIFLSVLVSLGRVNFPILFGLWVLHLSSVHAGQIFSGYGWETQLLELIFLSFFLFPLWRTNLFHPESPPKKIALFFLWWMLFRLMLGAGLIKIRGDSCWLDLTCTLFHYETQPNPHVLSWLWHFQPEALHKLGVLFNHLVEIVLPFFIFTPRRIRLPVAAVFAFFQISLVLSGNLAWLNWITLVMILPLLDDQALRRLLPFKIQSPSALAPTLATKITLIAFALSGLVLSVSPAMNLISPEQRMNTSYTRFHLINSYGAFGSIGRERFEVVISGTTDPNPGSGSKWLEYEFECKPGRPDRAPCWVTPYHLKLDWQIWFSAMRPELSELWLLRLAGALLTQKQVVLDLFAENPFPEAPPRFIKMDLYRYRMTSPLQGAWWTRELVQVYLPPISREHPALLREGF